MHVILLERVENLGQMGDEVKVKNGYARNYLLPQKKALRATDANRARFATDRTQLEARNLERRKEAEAVGAKLDGQSFIVIRQAGEGGQLYGSVNSRDIAVAVSEGGFSVQRNQIRLDRPIKSIGLVAVRVSLHPEVAVAVTLNVARSPEEADRQARGETLIGREVEEEAVEATELFESEELAAEAEQRAHEREEPAAGQPEPDATS